MSGYRWWSDSAVPIIKGLRLLVLSQIGYNMRQLESRVTKKLTEKIVTAGSSIGTANSRGDDSYPTDMYGSWLPPRTRDVCERIQIVGAGLKVYGKLISEGRYPGKVGYTVPLSKKQPSDTTTVNGETHSLLKNLNTDSFTVSKRTLSTKTTLSYGTDSMGMSNQSQSDDLRGKSEEKVKTQESQSTFYRPELPKGYKLSVASNTGSGKLSQERRVPSSRLARLASFGQLGLGLAAGAAAEVTRRAFKRSKGEDGVESDDAISPFLTPANAEKIVETLCKVRGAALKLGQMLSIQDSNTVSPTLLQIFDRVRHSADFMPIRQVHRQLRLDLGSNWKNLFADFEDKPFAAASIGQVHRATLLDGRKVAVKVQYPGVAQGIDSDIDNLITVLNVGNLFPRGLFLEEFVTSQIQPLSKAKIGAKWLTHWLFEREKVARRELKLECNYRREARAMKVFARLLEGSHHFYVPKVVDDLTSTHVLTAEYVEGVPVDACVSEPQQVRDYIACKFIELCLYEIFVWRFMQTDPNWSNFYFGKNPNTSEPCLLLLDFGASRSYSKKFVDNYMHIIRAAYDDNRDEILNWSRKIGFLTGNETKIMEEAHCDSILILGETLASAKAYDFSKQDITRRIHSLIPVMLKNRLKSPPEETYSLHRKLSGAYLLATKLKAIVSCGPLFESINKNYEFGGKDNCINIDSEPDLSPSTSH